jgi:hypothetical protein
MKLQKQTRSLLISATLAASLLSFTVGASAGLVYEGYADFELDLVDVSETSDQGDNCNGSGVCDGSNNGWSVSATSSLFDSDAVFSGSGFAEFAAALYPANDWAIGDSYFQTSESLGGSGGLAGNVNGTASSFADTMFSVTLENRSGSGSGSGGQSRNFDFNFFSYVSAYIDGFGFLGGDGGAYAEIVLFDSLGDILFSSAESFVGGPTDVAQNIDDFLTFTVGANSSYTFSGMVYTDGYSAAEVPTAPMFGLMSVGLFGILARKRRSSSTLRN